MNGGAGTEGKDGTRSVAWVLFFVLWFSFSYFHQPWTGMNQMSRLALLHSVFKEGRIEITTYHQNTMDKAVKDGRYYSDKAPGTVALAAPAFGVTALGLKIAGVELDSSRGWLVSSWVGCAASQGLLGALGGVALFLMLRTWVSGSMALLAAVGLTLGSLPMIYATTYFSHAAVAGCLAVAMWGLGAGQGTRDWVGAPGPLAAGLGNEWREWLAGFCCGWAIASEYSAALACGGLLWLAWERGGWFSVWRVVWGAVPPLLLIPAYHWACFGSPFTLGYGHEAVLKGMNRGLYGITFPPNLGNAYEMLFGPVQGILRWTPLLALAALGYPELFARSRRAFGLCYLVPVLHVVVMAGYYDPRAGGTVSARYYAPLLPLLAVPVALGMQRAPRIGAVLVTASVALAFVPAAVGLVVTVNNELDPWQAFFWPALSGGVFNSNLGGVMGLTRFRVLTPLLAVWVVGMGWMWWMLREDARPAVEAPKEAKEVAA